MLIGIHCAIQWLSSWVHRYNVSCSQHFKSSRGRSIAALAPPPAPTESTTKRRGPTRRSTSNNTSNKMSSRHVPVKVRNCWCSTFLTISKSLKKFKTSCELIVELFKAQTLFYSSTFIKIEVCLNCISATYSWEITKCWKLDWHWVGFDFSLSESALFWTQCHSESSRSEDVSSDGEEDEDDSSSLSPSSSHSCSKVGQNAPPADSPAPCSFQIEGSNFLSATPAQWSVEEVCRFISSLQGWCSWMTW